MKLLGLDVLPALAAIGQNDCLPDIISPSRQVRLFFEGRSVGHLADAPLFSFVYWYWFLKSSGGSSVRFRRRQIR